MTESDLIQNKKEGYRDSKYALSKKECHGEFHIKKKKGDGTIITIIIPIEQKTNTYIEMTFESAAPTTAKK
jgi:hypothetical protein